MAVKLCLDKVCPVKDCLAMACLAQATGRCREALVGMAVDKRLKLADGIKANRKAMVMDTRATRARLPGSCRVKSVSALSDHSRIIQHATWWRMRLGWHVS
jgi:hypothetical protein